MNNKQLSEIIDLIKEGHNGKFVVFENDGPAFVVMGIDEYKKMLRGNQDFSELSEKDLLENINKTIAEWRANQQDEDGMEDINMLSEQDEPQEFGGNYEEDDDDEGLSYYYDIDDDWK